MCYANRIDLFGSSPPVPSSSPFPLMSSCALARVEERRLNGFATPDKTSFSSPLARMQGQNANIINERAMSMSTPNMQLRSNALQHAASFRETFGHEGLRTSTTPDLRSSRFDACSSVKSSRERFLNSQQDEWMHAGSPEPELAGSGYGPGPTLSDRPFIFPQHRSSTSVAQIQVATEASPSPPIYEKTGESSAAGALRQTLAASKTRKSSWTDKLFRRREPSPVSDEAVSEFGYEEPQSPTESPKAILERIRARGAALNAEARGAADPDLPNADGGGRIEGHLGDEVEYEQHSSPAKSLHSLDPLFPEDEADHANLAASTTSSKAVSESSEPLKDVLSAATSVSGGKDHPVDPNSLLSLSSTFVAFEMAPGLPPVDCYIPPLTTEHSAKLILSAVKVTHFQRPLGLVVRRGLSFSTANALIQGSMSFAAIFFVLTHIGETVRGVEIGHDLVAGFLVGVMIVVVLHVDSILGGRVEQVSARSVCAVGRRNRAINQDVG
jgi:hypothetical protein